MIDTLPRCEPPPQFCELPFHWVQWRTPYRSEDPQPWGWFKSAKIWRPHLECSKGISPERAAILQYHYLEPAYAPPIRTGDEYEQVTIAIARVLTEQYYAVRFNKSPNDSLVMCAANDRWETMGLTQAQTLLDTLGRMGFSIRRW